MLPVIAAVALLLPVDVVLLSRWAPWYNRWGDGTLPSTFQLSSGLVIEALTKEAAKRG